MPDIKKTGLIPIAKDANYKTNYQIKDDNVGKYISLTGGRTFYNPGIGETLESPNNAQVTTDSYFKVSNTGGQVIADINGAPNKSGFLFFKTKNPVNDDILGTLKLDQLVINNGVNGVMNIDQIYSQGTYRIINVINAGVYVFDVSAKGTIGIQSNDGGFATSLAFYININHQEQLISKVYQSSTNNGNHNQQVNFDYDFTFNQTFNLNPADYVQIYGKVFTDYRKDFNTVIFNNQSFDLTIDNKVTNSITSNFTNPLNLPDFNTSSIKFYGAGRDTLILQNNKLIF